jgi:hypothetical protein
MLKCIKQPCCYLKFYNNKNSLGESTCLSKLCSHTRIPSKHTLRWYECCVHELITGVCLSVLFQVLDQIDRLLRNLYEVYANRLLLPIPADVMPCMNMKVCTTLRKGSSPLLMLGSHPELLQQEYQEHHINCESSYLSARGPLPPPPPHGSNCTPSVSIKSFRFKAWNLINLEFLQA